MSKIRFETQRVEKLYNRLQEKGTYIDINRAKYFTESFKETEGEELSLRFAKALLHIVRNIEISIVNAVSPMIRTGLHRWMGRAVSA